MEFEWDPDKARSNQRKHQVSFEEAVSVFGDPLSATILDPGTLTKGELRYITIGESNLRRLIVVVHCDRGETLRIISAERNAPRKASL